MRAFLAIPCPESVRSSLESLRDALSDRVDFRPVDTANFHVTVKFLGDTSWNTVERLDRDLRSRLPTTGPLKLTLNHVGVFPDPGSPSVAWVGVDDNDALMTVHETVETIAVEQGFEPEQHEYQPHVTLGRFNKGRDHREAVLDWIQEYGEGEYGFFEAPDLLLYESELQPDGPVYHERVRWPL